MRQISTNLFLYLAAGFFIMILTNSESALTAEDALPLGALVGKVVGPDGHPVPAARVWWESGKEKPLAETRTDAAGRFRLDKLIPVYRDWHSIYVEADGFALQYIPGETFSIFPGVDTDLGEIRLAVGRVFAGQVLDADGKPYPNAEVKCTVTRHAMGHTVANIGKEFSLTTDTQGRFKTHPLPVGQFCTWLIVPNRQLAYLIRPIRPGGEEFLEPLKLELGQPVHGTIHDDQGRPVAGIQVRASEYLTTSDSEGKFTIEGFGSKSPHFQMQILKEGYLFINWGVSIKEDGLHWNKVGDRTNQDHGPFKELNVVLQPVSWIEGQAVDAETGKPIRLEQIIRCNFDRKENGEVVLSGCHASDFEQPEDGHFRLSYEYPTEYHLALSASGYEDAETFTPKVTELKDIAGITVKMKKKKENSSPEVAKQSISGVVTREGRPVNVAWVSLWLPRGQNNNVNAWIMRGRTVSGEPIIYDRTLLKDGKYSLTVPYQSEKWCVVVEEPNRPLTLIGPMKIDLNEKKQLDITCSGGGSIFGRVVNVPNSWDGNLWVVAFTKEGIRKDTMADPFGEFAFPSLPPGEYGLKVGHDAYNDAEVFQGDLSKLSKEEWNTLRDAKNDPWQRATKVHVEPSVIQSGIELELPPEVGKAT